MPRKAGHSYVRLQSDYLEGRWRKPHPAQADRLDQSLAATLIFDFNLTTVFQVTVDLPILDHTSENRTWSLAVEHATAWLIIF